LTDFKRLCRWFEKKSSVLVSETEAEEMETTALRQLKQSKGKRDGWREHGVYGVFRILSY
jgi:hypothetical protein